jgi:hypothetical protein
MQQPKGFEVGGPEYVCKLNKSLYGLKQAGRVWNWKLHSVLLSLGFERVQSDHGLYIFSKDGIHIFMPVFVDDITLAGKKGAKFDSIIQELSSHFKLCDLGPTTQLLGMEIHRDRGGEGGVVAPPRPRGLVRPPVVMGSIPPGGGPRGLVCLPVVCSPSGCACGPRG